MRTLKLIIDDAELEKQLEGFEDTAVWRRPSHGERALSEEDMTVSIWFGDSRLNRPVLTPKPKPLPEPDWSKLGMLKSGTWLAMDGTGAWYMHEFQPQAQNAGWERGGDYFWLCAKYLNLTAFPSIPAERWKEACWMVP